MNFDLFCYVFSCSLKVSKSRNSQLISKKNCQAEDSSKKRRILVKMNSFVCFLEESSAWQFVFEINWPLQDFKFYKWTAKHLAKDSCTELTLISFLFVFAGANNGVDTNMLCSQLVILSYSRSMKRHGLWKKMASKRPDETLFEQYGTIAVLQKCFNHAQIGASTDLVEVLFTQGTLLNVLVL